jgi:hypothetical protein
VQAELGGDDVHRAVLGLGEQGEREIGEEQKPGGPLGVGEAVQERVGGGEVAAVAGGDDPGGGSASSTAPASAAAPPPTTSPPPPTGT